MVRLLPRQELAPVDLTQFNRVLQLAFSSRRKRIANGLKDLNIDWDRAEVDPGARPDVLTLDDFLRLANAVL